MCGAETRDDIFGWRASLSSCYLLCRSDWDGVCVCVCVFGPENVRSAHFVFHRLIIMSCGRHWAFDSRWIEIITQREIHCDRQAVDFCSCFSLERKTINSIDKPFNGNRNCTAPTGTNRDHDFGLREIGKQFIASRTMRGQRSGASLSNYLCVCVCIVCGIDYTDDQCVSMGAFEPDQANKKN